MALHDNICLVIPVFNPPPDKFAKLLDGLNRLHANFLIVDDGSEQSIKQIIADKVPDYRSLNHPRNLGKGAAIKTAASFITNNMAEVKGMITVDSDGQHLIKDIEKVCQNAIRHPDSLILGARKFDTNQPLKSKVGNYVTSLIFQIFFKIFISDTQTGLRYYPRKIFFEMCSSDSNRYEFETEIILLAKVLEIELRCCEIDSVYFDNNAATKFKPVTDSMLIYLQMLKFSLSGIFCFGIDLAVFGTLIVSGLDPLTSSVFARCISGVANFLLNRSIFDDRGNSKKRNISSVISYACLALTASSISGWASKVLLTLGVNPIASKISVDALLFFINFAVQKYWIFKS